MSAVRVLVGTRKGAFVLEADGKRAKWKIHGPHFAGWEIYHLKGSPADPNRIYASQSQQLVRSADSALRRRRPNVGAEGQPFRVRRHARNASVVRRHAASLGVRARLAPRAFAHRSGHGLRGRRRRRALSLDRRRRRRGKSCPACAATASAGSWQPGAGGMCLHTIVAGSAQSGSDLHRHLRGRRVSQRRRGHDLAPDQPRPEIERHSRAGSRSRPLRPPPRDAPVAPGVLFMQKHWDVMRSDDAGESWREVSGNLPTDFGFAIDVHAHEPETIYVVPIKSDSEHFPLDGQLRVYRSRSGGNEWESWRAGCRSATATSTCCATRWRSIGSTSAGSISARRAARCTFRPMAARAGVPIVRDLPAVLSVEVQTLP